MLLSRTLKSMFDVLFKQLPEDELIPEITVDAVQDFKELVEQKIDEFCEEYELDYKVADVAVIANAQNAKDASNAGWRLSGNPERDLGCYDRMANLKYEKHLQNVRDELKAKIAIERKRLNEARSKFEAEMQQ